MVLLSDYNSNDSVPKASRREGVIAQVVAALVRDVDSHPLVYQSVLLLPFSWAYHDEVSVELQGPGPMQRKRILFPDCIRLGEKV